MREIAELEVRRFFDGYLRYVVPEQNKALKSFTHVAIEAHDTDRAAHGGVERRVNRLFWLLIGGATVTGGGAGAMLSKLSSLIGG